MKNKIMKKLRKWKGVMSFLMALLILFYTVAVDWSLPEDTVYADGAKDRVKAFIELAKGKEQKEIEDIDKLSTDDLRFMGIYLSNFYVPFCTELGVSADSDNLKDIKSNMETALKTNLNFSDDVCSTFIENIMDMSRSSATELKMKYSKEYQSGYQDVPVSEGYVSNKFNFIALMCGDVNAIAEQNSNGYFLDLINKGDLKYIYWGYDGRDGFVPVMDCDVTGGSTQCMVVFQQCLASVENNYNQVLSIFDLGSREIKDIDNKKVGKLIGDIDDNPDGCYTVEQAYQTSVFGTKIAVDCFGNIIFMGANTQVIAIPGCMNPYTWMQVDSTGKDIGVGNNYVLVNFNSLGLLENSFISGISVDSTTGIRSGTMNSKLSSAFISSNINKSATKDVIDAIYKQIKDKVSDTRLVSTKTTTSWGKEKTTVKKVKIKLDKSESTIKDGIKKAITEGKSSYTIKAKMKNLKKGYSVSDSEKKKLTIKVSLSYGEFGAQYTLYRGQNFKNMKNLFGDNKMNCNLYTISGATSNVTYRDVLSKAYNGMATSNNINTSKLNSQWLNGDKTGNELKANLNTSKCSGEILDSMFIVDNLGAYSVEDFKTLNATHYIGDDGKWLKTFEKWGKSSSAGFTSKYNDIKDDKINVDIKDIDEASILNIYSTYAVACLYKEDAESKAATVAKLGYRLHIEGLPEVKSKNLNFEGLSPEEKQLRDIQDWVYYLLHPMEGLEYTRVLIKNKVNAILIGWHNDMLGTNGVGNTTGTTAYRSTTGYVSTPDLSEIKWTKSLIELYNRSIPFLIVIMLVIMLFAYVAGIMPLQRAAFGLVIFSMFLLAPVTVINNVVGLGNRVSQKIYGDKFTYWAVVQEESYVSSIDEYASKDTDEDGKVDSYSNYLRDLYSKNSSTYSNQGGDSIVLKWQAPKKMASLMFTEGDKNTFDSLKSSTLITKVFGRDSMSGQSYLDGESDYLYRSYTDLANFSRYIYKGISKGTQPSYTKTNVKEGTDLANSLSTISGDYEFYIKEGYTNYNKFSDTNYSTALRLVKPMSSSIYKDAVNKTGSIENMGISDFVGINQEAFNFSVVMFNQDSVGYQDLLVNATAENKTDLENLFKTYSGQEEQEIAGLAAYGLMSESPFYYYSWCLYDQGMDTGEKATGNYKTLLLGQDNGGYFYNNISNGELKDFMDMRSLFTYIIPYLKQGNDVVREWDDVYGISIYDGVPTDEGHWNDPDITNNEELKQKYWHNLNVARLYEIYTPWVDLMYDCSYAKPEKITVMGEKYVIQDPINPASYPDERPMIFSESEMYDYGLTEADLTEVERRILKCNRGMEERMYELLNYYSFSDVTLNTAAAMSCTFEFNTVFSSNGILSDNINLYPQSFEISDFSFDAFLRLILANTLGEDLITDINDEGSTDFYTTVVNKSSPTTAFMYILVDIASQYALPACKIFFIMAVFISSILLIIATAFKVDPEQRFINKLIKGIAIPMGGLLLINVGFSWVVSLFMGVGNNAVTQSNVLSIETGDPVITMLIIFALDAICILLYYKLLRGVIDDIKHNFKLSKAFVGGAIGGSISVVGKFASQLRGGAKGSSGVGSAGGTNYAEEGTGRQSVRASRRASENSAEGRSEEGSTRINDSKRETFKQSTSKKSKSTKEQKDKINNTIKSGSDNLKVDSNRAKDVVDRQNSNVVKDSGKNAK